MPKESRLSLKIKRGGIELRGKNQGVMEVEELV